MAKRTMEIVSRPMFASKDESQIFEMFDANISCEYKDDIDADNDFDIFIKSDYNRYLTSVAQDVSGQSNATNPPVAGTRDNATTFTRNAGSWSNSLNDNFIAGFRVWAYNSLVANSGTWHTVVSNDMNTIVVTGTLPADCDYVQLQAKTLIRNSIQVNPRIDFYGSFFQYRVLKRISVDGIFKFFGFRASLINKNIDPEFFTNMGEITDNWTGE